MFPSFDGVVKPQWTCYHPPSANQPRHGDPDRSVSRARNMILIHLGSYSVLHCSVRKISSKSVHSLQTYSAYSHRRTNTHRRCRSNDLVGAEKTMNAEGDVDEQICPTEPILVKFYYCPITAGVPPAKRRRAPKSLP